MTGRADQLSDDLYQRILEVTSAGDTLQTLSRGEDNHIVEIAREGIRVNTARSKRAGTTPLVPAWMIESAWDQLRRDGTLTNRELLDDLNVKRSSFVCALLARFPDVLVATTSPIKLELRRRS